MNYHDVTLREKDAAEARGVRAGRDAQGLLLPVLTVAATAAITAARSDDPAAAMRRLRTDEALLQAIDQLARRARRQVGSALVASILAGFEQDADLRGQALSAQAPALAVTVTLSDDERSDLAAWPIQGHSAAEVADHLVLQLRYAIDGAVAVPLSGTADPTGIPAALSAVAAAHGGRVESAVREAYFAGVQAATRALGAALVGA